MRARQLLVLALAVFGLLLGAGTALAHDVLVGSDPANGARLGTGPSKVTLSYDLPVRDVSSTLTVIGPDGLHYESGPSVVDGNTVSAPVGPLGPAGLYTVGYRIISDDGHPVSGEITFTLTTAGTGHGAARSPASAGSPPGPDTGSSGNGILAWPWIVGAVVLVAGGATVALRMR
jgi:copper resistance protein C